MNRVSGLAQLVGERPHAVGQPLDVVVEQHLGHQILPSIDPFFGTFGNVSLFAPWRATRSPPDYDLADRIALTEPAQVKALGHPLRNTILSLLHERAATVNELAAALGRPKSTVAHHVKVLREARLVRVVRTRRVRAIEERFYGRTARTLLRRPELWRRPAAPGLQRLRGRRGRVDGRLRGREPVGFHPPCPDHGGAGLGVLGEDGASLVEEFDRLPRSGDRMYGFAVGVYPTDHPTLREGHEDA